MKVTIRPARAGDGDAMLALMPRLADFDIPATRRAEHLWTHDAELLQQWLAGRADGCYVHVAADERGTVVGMAMFRLRPELLSDEPSAHLEAIAVARQAEGKGVAAALLAACEEDARSRGALSMTLHVFACNRRARAFYDRSGYDGELMRYTKPLEGG
ncbi:MAG: GNAT family N-acetyltransferase [Gammaproteobacteria bacterium]|nr:GNAT family N-acetyltransferase [Gammaproteobacteria bacterium]MDH4254500.1 GNAT family N-acetyltransferase [Gammaproteobacteria bacterium]MDH5309104.1 GNAT family N-acetyltransferase [Gammaproteobacteria bacterium]